MESEVIFAVEDAPEGGYTAHALGYSIFTQAETMDELRLNLREAIQVHFDDGERPKTILLHYVRDEIILV